MDWAWRTRIASLKLLQMAQFMPSGWVLHPGMRFQNAIWHVFLLVASMCLFAAIWISP